MKMHLGKPEKPFDLQLSSAKGSYIYDTAGREYIDFMGGSCVGNLGWDLSFINNELLKTAVSYASPHLKYQPWEDLAEALVSIVPGNLEKCFRTTGGSESIDAAMQMAMVYTGRTHFLSVEGAYHGNTIGALSIGASKTREKVKNLLPNCHKIELPLEEEALRKAEEILRKKETAAFIMEPVITNLGVYEPGKTFMTEIQRLCKETGTLFVADEVATGFGRTGKLFASEHHHLKPDIMCLAKAMSSGHAGIGAVLTTEEVAEKTENETSLYSTYGWHPISVAAALSTIRYWKENQTSLLNNVEEMSALFSRSFSEMQFQAEPNISICGLAINVDVQDEEYAMSIHQKCLDNGLLFNAEPPSLTFFPALNIERESVEKGLDVLQDSI